MSEQPMSAEALAAVARHWMPGSYGDVFAEDAPPLAEWSIRELRAAARALLSRALGAPNDPTCLAVLAGTASRVPEESQPAAAYKAGLTADSPEGIALIAWAHDAARLIGLAADRRIIEIADAERAKERSR